MGFAREPTTLDPPLPVWLDAWSRSDSRPLALRIDCVDARAMLALETAWSDLAQRAIEPNVFLMPAFAIPLLQHVRFKARPKFLLVWDDGPESDRRLVGLLPFADHAQPRLGWRSIQGFHHPQVALGTPLIDENAFHETIEAMLDWLGGQSSRPASLLLRLIPTESAFCIALKAACARRGRTLLALDAHRRAILRNHGPSKPLLPSLSPKRRKELGRQRRRMEGFGALTYRRATTPAAIRQAAERFLALEFEGWKGRRNTALLADPTLATFTRTMTRLMAHAGQCRIDSLEIDGVPVAMGILVTVGNRAQFWKTTFSERFAMYSPGVQFTLALTQVQAQDDTLDFTDSCAVPDHSMIDRLWADRIDVADIMIELWSPARDEGAKEATAKTFAWAVRCERLRRSLRRGAKTLIHALRKRLERAS